MPRCDRRGTYFLRLSLPREYLRVRKVETQKGNDVKSRHSELRVRGSTWKAATHGGVDQSMTSNGLYGLPFLLMCSVWFRMGDRDLMDLVLTR